MNRTQIPPNEARILDALRAVRNRGEHVDLSRALARSLVIAAAALAAACVSEAVLHFGIEGRTVLFFVLTVLLSALLVYFPGRVLLRRFTASRRISIDDTALAVGAHFPHVHDRLLDALQVMRALRSSSQPGFSPALADAAFASVAGDVGELDLTSVVDGRPARRAWRNVLLVMCVAAVPFALFPHTMIEAGRRLMHFRTDFAPPAPFAFSVRPGDIEVVKGEPVSIEAATDAFWHPTVGIRLREEGQEDFSAVMVEHDSAGSSRHSIAAARGTFSYFAEADGYRSRHYTVRVVDRPIVRIQRVKLVFPAYTRLAPRTLENNTGDIAAPGGTVVALDLRSNKDLASATIVFADSTRIGLAVDGDAATGSFHLRKDGAYHVDLLSAEGVRSVNPVTYALKVLPDMPPSIDLIEPGKNVDIDGTMRLPLLIGVADDYGFSKLILHYRLSASRYEKPGDAFTSITLPLPAARGGDVEVPYTWNLTSLSLVPEDEVSYYAEVFDNDVITGPKSARTAVFTVRLPSLEEAFARADRKQEDATDDLQKSLSEAEDIKKQMQDVRREMKQQNSDKPDWQQKKKLEQLMQRQEDLLKNIDQVREQMSDLKQDFRKQDLISDETMKKYEELERIMREMDSPELREAMKRMQATMDQLSPEQMKQAMENMQFNQDALRESIERTIELLKRIQIEQKVDEMTRRAADLAKKQEDLANRTEKADPQNQKELDKLANEQRELQKQAEAMQREMKELQKMMEQFPQDMPLSDMKEAQAELNASQMQQQMEQVAGMCQGGNCKSAATGQKKMAQQLQKFQQKMENIKKKMNEEEQKQLARAMQKALAEVLALSMRQEDLKNRVAKLQGNSPQFRDAAREQQRLMDDLNQTATEMMEASKKSVNISRGMGAHMGQALNLMRQSLGSLQNRDQVSGSQIQAGAMAELNESAKQISKSMQSMKSGGQSSGSMMQQLQRLASQQAAINQESRQMQGMSQQQMAAMTRLLQEQRGVQKSLQELNEEARRSEEGKRLLGDLERVAQDMQEVVRDMQQGEVNPNTLQQQEHILSRLLDASRSMRERDWEKQRRSRTGTNVSRRSPSALDPDQLDPKSGLRRDLQKAVDEGYSRDYEALIRRYFEALQQSGVGARAQEPATH
jgi:hypothetical protein